MGRRQARAVACTGCHGRLHPEEAARTRRRTHLEVAGSHRCIGRTDYRHTGEAVPGHTVLLHLAGALVGHTVHWVAVVGSLRWRRAVGKRAGCSLHCWAGNHPAVAEVARHGHHHAS